jgi:hypothetical protein
MLRPGIGNSRRTFEPERSTDWQMRQSPIIAPVAHVRVDASRRALGVDIPEGVLWFWIGTHAEYDDLVG